MKRGGGGVDSGPVSPDTPPPFTGNALENNEEEWDGLGIKTTDPGRERSAAVFIDAVHGQSALWGNVLGPVADDCDPVHILGNLIGTNEWASDHAGGVGGNELVLRSTLHKHAGDTSWRMCLGAGEVLALNSPGEWTSSTSDHILRAGVFSQEPALRAAYEHQGRLVSSAGLTYGMWRAIGSPQNAGEAAARLNEAFSGARALTGHGKCFAFGYAPDYTAGPVFADTFFELVPSWTTAPVACPFDQILSIRTGGGRSGRAFFNDVRNPCNFVDSLSYTAYGVKAVVKGSVLTMLATVPDGPLVRMLPYYRRVYVERGEKPLVGHRVYDALGDRRFVPSESLVDEALSDGAVGEPLDGRVLRFRPEDGEYALLGDRGFFRSIKEGHGA